MGVTTLKKLGVRELILSPAIFVGLLLALSSVDDRVRDRFSNLVSPTDGLAPWGRRLTEFGDALASAMQYQSIENAPLLIFAAVGVTLTLFMFKS